MIFDRQTDGRYKPGTQQPSGTCFAVSFDHLECVLVGGELPGQHLLKGEFIEHVVINPDDPRLYIYIGKVDPSSD